MTLERLCLGNAQYCATVSSKAEIYRGLAHQGQHPQVLWIGCSDSRVLPEQIVCAEPGELFIVRNIANVVPPCDAGDDSVGAAIEYAIQHLHVVHLIVCGHTQCGGMAAVQGALDEAHEPHIAHWLEYAREALDAVPADLSGEVRYLASIRANVLLQCAHLRTYPCVAEALATGQVTLHAWMYDLLTGELSAHCAETDEWAPLTV